MNAQYKIESQFYRGAFYYDVVEIRDGKPPLHIQQYQTEGGANVAIRKLMTKGTKGVVATVQGLQAYIAELEAYIAELEGYLK